MEEYVHRTRCLAFSQKIGSAEDSVEVPFDEVKYTLGLKEVIVESAKAIIVICPPASSRNAMDLLRCEGVRS